MKTSNLKVLEQYKIFSCISEILCNYYYSIKGYFNVRNILNDSILIYVVGSIIPFSNKENFSLAQEAQTHRPVENEQALKLHRLRSSPAPAQLHRARPYQGTFPTLPFLPFKNGPTMPAWLCDIPTGPALLESSLTRFVDALQ